MLHPRDKRLLTIIDEVLYSEELSVELHTKLYYAVGISEIEAMRKLDRAFESTYLARLNIKQKEE